MIGETNRLEAAQHITDSMFYEAAKALASQVTKEELASGSCYPNLNNIRRITANVARAVCKVAESENLNTIARPDKGWATVLTDGMWWPQYEEYL